MPELAVPSPPSFVPFDRRDLEQSIPSRFERVAMRGPDRLAVKWQEQAWTYGELNAAANRIAVAVIEAIGHAPRPVALLLDQGADLVAALLAVLKSGHFYVPLDVTHPSAAMVHTLEDSGAALILTNARRLPMACQLLPQLTVIDIDALSQAFCNNPKVDVAPDALACIYYTSGSTGGPQGVADTHRNILHNVLRYTNGLKISPTDRLTLVQSPTFSGVMSTIFGALLNGAAIFPFDIPTQGVARIGPWLLNERVTMYHSVPAIFRHFLRVVGEGQAFPEMRVVRLEGDGASLADVTLYKRHFPRGCVLAHGLGATECGLVRRLVINRGSELAGDVVPIGYAVEDVIVRILDDQERAVADGEIGNIAVESRYLAPGYWRRPDLTAAAFTPGWESGTRLYRTGDVGRLQPDGCLEHLGRKDGQPKVRGHRVDVETIEAALLGTGLVAEGVVAVRATSGRDALLVAYVVPCKGAVNVWKLRRNLAGRLPSHMVPTRFVVLDELPLTANHKIDRAALPSPDTERPRLGTPFLAPRSDLETSIAAAWAATLGFDHVGVRDDFFDLGGDSLDAVAVLGRMSETLGREMPPLSLFESPTVEHLARAIVASDAQERPGVRIASVRHGTSSLVPVQPLGSRSPFFFLHAEYGGDGFYCLNLARQLGTDQPFFGLSPLGRDDEPTPRAIEAMAAVYLTAVRDVQRRGPYALGGYCSCAVVAWEMARQLIAAGEEVSLLALVEPPAVDDGRTARLVHGAADVLSQLGAKSDRRVDFVVWAMRLSRLRSWRALTTRGLSMVRRDALHRGTTSIDRRSVIAETYGRAVEAYRPGRFDGRVLCLASEDTAADAIKAWRRLSTNFTERRIPGDHESCILTHARSLAAELAAGLAVQGGSIPALT